MSSGEIFLRMLLLPGFLGALLLGLFLRGLAAWLGAHLGRRPARPAWYPLLELLHLLGKKPPAGSEGSPFPIIWPAPVVLLCLSWGLALLPWGPRPPGEPFPGGLFLYLFLLAGPPLARLLAAAASADLPAALGVRRQAPLEVARLIGLFLAGGALALLGQGGTLSLTPAGDTSSGAVALGIAALTLMALPWPMWDRDAYAAPLSALGGRALALFRAVESLELCGQVGLVAVAVQAAGLFPAGRPWPAPTAAILATLILLAVWESRPRRLPLDLAFYRYTRWLLPLAVVVTALAWWVGMGE